MSGKEDEMTGKPAHRAVQTSPPPRRSDVVGEKLREMYDQVVQEPVPEDFMDLLERAEKAAGDSSSAEEESQ
jgi:hypothetical protein